jgi:hypothetical protein
MVSGDTKLPELRCHQTLNPYARPERMTPRHSIRATLARAVLAFLVCTQAAAEEKPNQIFTSLDSGTISGSISTVDSAPPVAPNAIRHLEPGTYSTEHFDCFGQEKAIVVVALSNGQAQCQLATYNPFTGNYFLTITGTFTNKASGLVKGKCILNHDVEIDVTGRVTKDGKGANLRIGIGRPGSLTVERVRRVKLLQDQVAE